jgi:hypothetical protein
MADKKISALPAATTPLAGTEVLPIVQGGTTDQVSVANLTVGRDVSAKTLTGESNGAGAVTEIFARNSAGPERVQIISRNTAGVSYVQTQNSQLLIGSFDNFAVQFMVNNSSKVVLETNSDVKVSTGNLVIGTAAKGIDFSANGGDVLSQYDEGTWTVQLFDAGSGGNASPTTVTGYYTRVGRMVTATFGGLDNISTVGMTAGNYLFVTLPFTSSASVGFSSAVITTSSINFGIGYTYCSPSVGLNSNRASFSVSGSAVGLDALLVSALTSGVSSIPRFSVTYFV